MGWVLCIGLLFPVAQAAADVHGVSHVGRLSGPDGPIGSGAQAHCAMCLLAAAIGGAAPLAEPVAAPVSRLAHATPAEAIERVRRAAAMPCYESRAPPRPSR